MIGYLIYYNTWEKGMCVTVEIAPHVLQAIVQFARLRKVKSISEVRIIQNKS